MNNIKKISFVVDKPYYNNKIFDSEYLGSNFFELVKENFSKKGIEICSNDLIKQEEADIILYNDFRKKDISNNKLHVLLALESIAVKPDNFNVKKIKNFDSIYTWNSKIVDGKNIFKLNYSYDLRFEKFNTFNKKKFFLCNISANKLSNHKDELYSERIKACEFFQSKPISFHLYGYDWDKALKFPRIYNLFKSLYITKLTRFLSKVFSSFIVRVGASKIIYKKYDSYQGTIDNKLETLKNYKFSICYENVTNIEGYITEKIFDCFRAGTIPIYLGANDIKNYIPESTFIDKRNFSNYDELYSYLSSIDEHKFARYQENISNYLESNQAEIFDSKYNAKILVDGIIRDYNNKFLL